MRKTLFLTIFPTFSQTKMSYFIEKCEFIRLGGGGTAKEKLWSGNSGGNARGRETFDKRMSFREFIFLIDVKKAKTETRVVL